MTLDLHSRVVTPDGSRGRIVGTMESLTLPRQLKVRLDGAPAIGPHPWFVAEQLQLEPEKVA